MQYNLMKTEYCGDGVCYPLNHIRSCKYDINTAFVEKNKLNYAYEQIDMCSCRVEVIEAK